MGLVCIWGLSGDFYIKLVLSLTPGEAALIISLASVCVERLCPWVGRVQQLCLPVLSFSSLDLC